MAAVTSTSLGTEAVNTSSASSDRSEDAGMSFADSFDGGTVLADKTQSHVTDPTKLMAIVEIVDSTTGKTASTTTAVVGLEAKASVNVASKVQNETPNTKPSELPKVGKVTISVGGKTSSSVVGAVLQHGRKLNEDTVLQSKMLDGQPSPDLLGDKKLLQRLVPGAPDGSTLNDIDVTAELHPKTTALPAISAIDSDVKLVVANKGETSMPSKAQEASPSRKSTNDHDTPVKAEKPIKADKTEEKVGMTVNTTGVDTPTAVCAFAVVDSMSGPQSGLKTAIDDNALSPLFLTASGRSVGTAVTASSKSNKETAHAEKSNGDKMKTFDLAPTEDAASQKVDVDASKAGLVTASSQDGDKAKVHSMAVLVTDTGQMHAAPGMTGPLASNASGRALTNEAGVNLRTTEAISHAVATVQAGSGPIDMTVPSDTAHKTLMVTPTSLEVGVSDGTHGWLKIRAEMTDAGAVNTSLSTSSPSGQEMLHRELSSLTAYLQNEHVAVNAVVVQPTIASGADPRNSFGGTGGSEHGQTYQSGDQGSESRQKPPNAVPTHAQTNALYSGIGSAGENEVLSSASYVGGGSWLSVRA